MLFCTELNDIELYCCFQMQFFWHKSRVQTYHSEKMIDESKVANIRINV